MEAVHWTHVRGLAVVLLTLFGACAMGGEEQVGAARERGVNVYLLKDPKLTAHQAVKMPLEALPLRDEPWIASANIHIYDASAHHIYLKQAVGRDWERISHAGTPFVVTADGNRCYLGALWTMISSATPPSGVPTTTVSVRGWPTAGPIELAGAARVLSNERAFRTLKRDGQFRAGIEVTLDKVVVLHEAEGSSIRYVYTVTNRDRDPLYLLDTDRMGYDSFRRMQNGIAVFIDPNGKRHVRRPNPLRGLKTAPAPHGTMGRKWFVRLASGESMTRKATEPHFRRVPTGRYACMFYYGFLPFYARRLPGVGDAILKGKPAWSPGDGRVWLGRLTASRKVRVEGPVEF